MGAHVRATFSDRRRFRRAEMRRQVLRIGESWFQLIGLSERSGTV